MKFFRDRPLRVQAALLLSFFAIIIILEFVFIRWRVSSLEELHYQQDFTRKAQLMSQQIMMKANLLLQGRTNLEAQILADIEQHDHMLNILSEGGRIDGTSVFIDKLDRLPSISLKEVNDHWLTFKQNVNQASVQVSTERKKMLEANWISISSWYNKLINDIDRTAQEVRSSINGWIAFIIVLDIALLALFYFLFRKHIVYPLKHIEENTASYSLTTGLSPGEISDVAVKVNDVTEQLKDASQFIQEIGRGNLSMDYKDLDTHYIQGKHKLADSLIEMQRKLREMNAEEQRRQWANDGLAKFVDILRTSGENIGELGDKIIATLVSYTRSNQGALYLLNDDEASNKYLELISLFAFDTRKFETQKIKLGEGILGQTFLEKETTHLTDMPQEYIRITSGLGGANPKSLLMVPLKIDQTVYGVVELASFNEYKEHEVKFVERLSETIASTFASVKSAQRNRSLLEESHSVTEMMRAQEEEMRQNMEELQATQEEMARKERDYITKINQLEKRVGERAEPSQELDHAKQEVADLRAELNECRRELTDTQEKMKTKSDDWSAAEAVEKALKINLEALKITRKEMGQDPS